MQDQEKTASVQLAFELGRITRHAMHRCNACDHQVELSKIADARVGFQSQNGGSSGRDMTIVLAGDASASNVFWQVVGAVTIGAAASFSGTILTLGAPGAITVGAGAALTGRALSAAAAVSQGRMRFRGLVLASFRRTCTRHCLMASFRSIPTPPRNMPGVRPAKKGCLSAFHQARPWPRLRRNCPICQPGLPYWASTTTRVSGICR